MGYLCHAIPYTHHTVSYNTIPYYTTLKDVITVGLDSLHCRVSVSGICVEYYLYRVSMQEIYVGHL